MPVETGRYRKIPLKKRICPICDKNNIGDEFHYTMECTNKVFSKLRESFMQDLNIKWIKVFQGLIVIPFLCI